MFQIVAYSLLGYFYLELLPRWLGLGQQALEPLVGRTSSRREEALAVARELLAANRSEGLVGGLEALKNRPDATGDLRRIAVPTTVVVGEQDGRSPPGAAKEMADAIADARFTVVADAGHLTNLENPVAFNRALEELLARV